MHNIYFLNASFWVITWVFTICRDVHLHFCRRQYKCTLCEMTWPKPVVMGFVFWRLKTEPGEDAKVVSQTTWISKCWKVIVECFAQICPKPPTPALTELQFYFQWSWCGCILIEIYSDTLIFKDQSNDQELGLSAQIFLGFSLLLGPYGIAVVKKPLFMAVIPPPQHQAISLRVIKQELFTAVKEIYTGHSGLMRWSMTYSCPSLERIHSDWITIKDLVNHRGLPKLSSPNSAFLLSLPSKKNYCNKAKSGFGKHIQSSERQLALELVYVTPLLA